MPKINTEALINLPDTEDPVSKAIHSNFGTSNTNILSFNQGVRASVSGGLAPRIMLSSSKVNIFIKSFNLKLFV